MTARVYTRKFDYDEARRRHAAGESVSSLAREFGVAWGTVGRLVNPKFAARLDATSKAWIMSGVCPDCGKQGVTRSGHGAAKGRCRDCALRRLTLVTDTHAHCATCKQWKPRAEFCSNVAHRKTAGGIHGQCRSCQTKARRDYRRRHRAEDNAYQRAYKAKKRAEAKRLKAAA